MDFLASLAPILVALGGLGGIAALVKAFFARDKDKADAAAVITDSTKDLLGPLREELARQRQELAEQRGLYEELKASVRQLEATLRDEEKRSWALVRYVRQLIDSHKQHAPLAEIPPAPAELEEFI